MGDVGWQAVVLTVCLVPLTAAAVFVSGFRLALGLCCCSPLFWCVRTLISKPQRTLLPNKPRLIVSAVRHNHERSPVVFPDGARPETSACSLIFSNW